MEATTKRSNKKILLKVFSIGFVLAISYAASLFVQSVVTDRLTYQTQVVATQSGNTSSLLIFSKVPGFDTETGVSVYRLVDRVVKYAILFITLTFLMFFLAEIFYKLRLHPIQYLLTGLALAEFYLLLLALTEHIGFMNAYITATVMTVSLITLYSRYILKSKKGALFIATSLSVIYGYLLMVINLETLALLSGSILLFALISLIMLITRNTNWYETFGYLQTIE